MSVIGGKFGISQLYFICLVGEKEARQFEESDLQFISEDEFQSAQLLSA
jgi:hypothetical protein